MKAISLVIAAAGTAAGLSPAASAATSRHTYRIIQRINGINVCLDEGFEFSRCQYSSNPDDPPSLQKWTLAALANGTDQIKNPVGGGKYYCLDVKSFTLPCAAHDKQQQWVRVSAGNGTYYVENRSTRHRQCLDSFWSFKACARGDKQQIWQFKPVS